MPANVYSYDSRTHEYVGETIADDDPEQEGELLHPAFTTPEPPPEDLPEGKVACWDRTTWVVRDKTVVLPPAEVLHPARRAEALTDAALDRVAQSLGYKDIISAVSYADEPAVPGYQVEGQRLRRLRSLMWAECYSVLGEVGDDWPGDAAFLARLPTYDEMVIMEQQEGGS